MNARFVIALLLLLSSYYVKSQFADKSHYLIDSLKLDKLTQDDRNLLDSALTLYYKAEHDTDRLNALGIICENMMHESWYEYQFFQYEMIKSLLDVNSPDNRPDTPLQKKYLSFFAAALNNIGYIHQSQGDIVKGLENYHESLKIVEEIGDKKGVADVLNNIAYIYKNQGDIDKGLEYFQKSLEMYEEIGDKDGMAASLNNIGASYKYKKDNNKALAHYDRSLAILEEIGYKKGIAVALNNIGYIYKSQGDITTGLKYFHRSLKIREDIGDKHGIAVSLHNIGNIYLEQEDLPQAIKYGKRSLKLGKELGFPNDIKDPARLLSKGYKKDGNYKEALTMYELYIIMRDSIKNEETQKAAIRQQTKYEFEKEQLIKDQEENEVARLEAEATNRRDNIQYSVILIAILILFGGVLALGFINLSERMAEGIIFFSFLILFEFLLVLADPYIEGWSGGAPGIKLLFNAGIAALIFPAHAFFESKLKKQIVK